jgi:hypothetical protein
MKKLATRCLFSRHSAQHYHFFALSAPRYGLVLVLSQSHEFIDHFEQPYK